MEGTKSRCLWYGFKSYAFCSIVASPTLVGTAVDVFRHNTLGTNGSNSSSPVRTTSNILSRCYRKCKATRDPGCSPVQVLHVHTFLATDRWNEYMECLYQRFTCGFSTGAGFLSGLRGHETMTDQLNIGNSCPYHCWCQRWMYQALLLLSLECT